MANGWIKIHRSMFDDEWYFSEKFTREQAWIDLLLLAEYKPRVFLIRNNEVRLVRGQLAISIRNLAERWKWGINKVQSFIKELEDLKRIDTQKSHLVNVISICNYEIYQAYDPCESREIDTQTDTHTDTHTDTQTDTPLRSIKKHKNNIISSVSDETRGSDSKIEALLEEIKELREKVNTLENPPAEKPKRTKKANPLITPCREIFETYYNEIFDSAYYWQAKDAVAMGSLTKKLINSRKAKNLPTEDEDIKGALKFLLTTITDEWMLKNFSVTNIDSKYNEIVAQARQKSKQVSNGTSSNNRAGNKSSAQSRANDVASIIAHLGAKNKPVEG